MDRSESSEGLPISYVYWNVCSSMHTAVLCMSQTLRQLYIRPNPKRSAEIKKGTRIFRADALREINTGCKLDLIRG